MGKKVEIEYPEFGITCMADLLEDEEPELCERLWSLLPLRSMCVHTLSTGEYYFGRFRPSREASSSGTQLKPIGRHKVKNLCENKPGEVAFAGGWLTFTYGPNITEPMPGGGPVVAQVIPEDLEKFENAGKAVWKNQLSAHKLVTVVLKRKEA